MKPRETVPMKRRRFFVTLAAGAAGIVGLRHLRIFPRVVLPPDKPKAVVSINPLAVPRKKNGGRNG